MDALAALGDIAPASNLGLQGLLSAFDSSEAKRLSVMNGFGFSLFSVRRRLMAACRSMLALKIPRFNGSA